MVRVTDGAASHRKRKRLFKRAKGFVGDRKNHLRQTKNAVMSAMSFNYIHRKHKKANFRSLWITRIGIASKINGISYSKMMFGLKKAGCPLNRKALSEMAIHDPKGFEAVVDIAKKGLAA